MIEEELFSNFCHDKHSLDQSNYWTNYSSDISHVAFFWEAFEHMHVVSSFINKYYIKYLYCNPLDVSQIKVQTAICASTFYTW